VALATIAVGHLRVELAFLGGSFAGTGEIRALAAFATHVSGLTTTFTVAATTATSTSASTATTAVATRTSVLGGPIATFRARGCFAGSGVVARGCDGCGRGVGVRRSLLFALPFALALTLCLPFGVSLRVAFTRRRLLTWWLCFARRLAWRWGGVTVASVFTVTVTTATFLVTIAAFLVAMTVAAMGAAIAIASTIFVTMAIATMPRTAAITFAMTIAISVAMPITARLAAGRRLLGGLRRGSRTGE